MSEDRCYEKPTRGGPVQLYEHTHQGSGAGRLLKEPVDGEYYYASPEFMEYTGYARKYYLMFWRETEGRALQMADTLRKSHPKYGFKVSRIPFMNGNKAIVRYGVYATKKIGVAPGRGRYFKVR